MYALAWSGETCLAACSAYRSALRLDLSRRIPCGTVADHDGDIYALDTGGALVATGSKDRTVQISDTRQRSRPSLVLREHTGSVLDVRLRQHRLVSASLDKTVRMWDLRSPTAPFRTLDGHAQGVHCVDFSDELVVSGGPPYCMAD